MRLLISFDNDFLNTKNPQNIHSNTNHNLSIQSHINTNKKHYQTNNNTLNKKNQSSYFYLNQYQHFQKYITKPKYISNYLSKNIYGIGNQKSQQQMSINLNDQNDNAISIDTINQTNDITLLNNHHLQTVKTNNNQDYDFVNQLQTTTFYNQWNTTLSLNQAIIHTSINLEKLYVGEFLMMHQSDDLITQFLQQIIKKTSKTTYSLQDTYKDPVQIKYPNTIDQKQKLQQIKQFIREEICGEIDNNVSDSDQDEHDQDENDQDKNDQEENDQEENDQEE